MVELSSARPNIRLWLHSLRPIQRIVRRGSATIVPLSSSGTPRDAVRKTARVEKLTQTVGSGNPEFRNVGISSGRTSWGSVQRLRRGTDDDFSVPWRGGSLKTASAGEHRVPLPLLPRPSPARHLASTSRRVQARRRGKGSGASVPLLPQKLHAQVLEA